MASGTPTTPWLSVVTVVKDDADGLTRSCASLATQDTNGVEHVVVDSSQPRLNVPSSVDVQRWMEPAGIYAAMNAALVDCAGDYVFFLNAGDTFHDADVLGSVRNAVTASQPMWAYGAVEIVERGGSRTVTPRWDYRHEQAAGFSGGHFPAHQGTFVRRTVLEDMGGFDPSYAIVADYAAFLRLSQLSDPLHLNLVVATFREGGVSTTQWRHSLAEFHRARRSILHLHGAASLREYANTAKQYVAMTAYRGIWAKVAGR